MSIITFGQQNYPNLKLGNTPFTFAKYGCLSDVVTMGYDYLFGQHDGPEQIVPKLQYDANGILQWPSLDSLGMELKQTAFHVGHTPTDVINKWWSNPNVCCALELNMGTHFVWQIGRYWPVLGYRVFDPWENKTKFLNTGITGCRIFGKK